MWNQSKCRNWKLQQGFTSIRLFRLKRIKTQERDSKCEMSGRFLRSEDTRGLNPEPLHLQSTSGAHSTPALLPDPRWPYKQQLPLGQGHWNKWMPPALPPLNKGLQQGCTQCWEQRGFFLSGASLQAAATAGIWGTWAPGGSHSRLPKGRGITCRVAQWQWTKGKFRPGIRQINCWEF